MNTSPWLEIVVAIAILTFFGVLIGRYIYKKIHHIPTGECAMCHKRSLLDEYRKMYPKNK